MKILTQEENNWVKRNLATAQIQAGLEAGELKLLPKVSSDKKDPIGFYLYNNCITVMEKIIRVQTQEAGS